MIESRPFGRTGLQIAPLVLGAMNFGMPTPRAIAGPRTMAQLDDALAVLGLMLDDEARVACDALVHPGNAVSDFHNPAAWLKATVATNGHSGSLLCSGAPHAVR